MDEGHEFYRLADLAEEIAAEDGDSKPPYIFVRFWCESCTEGDQECKTMILIYRLLSSTFGRGLRMLLGMTLVGVGVLWDSQGSLIWLLILPGTATILGALMNLNLTAPLFGLPAIGSGLRTTFDDPGTRPGSISNLTFVGDSLRRQALGKNRD